MRAVILAAALLIGLGNAPAPLAQRIDALLEQGAETAAFMMAQEATDNSDGEGHGWLGHFYETGTGTQQDYDAASRHYRMAAEAGQNHARWRLGVLIDAGKIAGSLSEAVTLFETAADEGYSDAVVSLAVMQATGRGTPQDYAAALSNYKRAAALGNDHAIRGVGVMIFNGEGVAADPIEASAWFLVSAALGNVEGEESFAATTKDMNGSDMRLVARHAEEISRALGFDFSFAYEDAEDRPVS